MGIIIIPGPNVLVVISTSLAYGRARGLQTVAGTSAAMLVQLFIAALGTAWFVSALASGFLWLKWLGVGYLFYLGIRHLLAIGQHQREQQSVFLLLSARFLSLTDQPQDNLILQRISSSVYFFSRSLFAANCTTILYFLGVGCNSRFCVCTISPSIIIANEKP